MAVIEEPTETTSHGFLTLVEAAKLLGLQPITLRKQVVAGKLRTERIGRMHVTTHAWVEEYRATHYRQQGRSSEVTAASRYLQQFKSLYSLGRHRTLENYERISVQAGVATIYFHPTITNADMIKVVSEHRRSILQDENEEDRQRSVAAIVSAIFSHPSVDLAQFEAQRQEARTHPSVMGTRWEELFGTYLGETAEDVSPENIGVIARIDQRVADTLATEVLTQLPDKPLQDVRAELMQAMLEGSMNLPRGARECREVLGLTATRAIRHAIEARRQPRRRAGGAAG